MNNKIFKAGKFTAVYYAIKFVPLALLTFIPTIIIKPDSLFSVIATYGANILFVVIVFSLSLLYAHQKSIITLNNQLIFQQGVIFRQKSIVAKQNIKSITIEKRFLPAIFNCEKICFFSSAKGEKSGDFSVFVSKKDSRKIVRSFYYYHSFKTIYKSNFRILFLTALTSSNALTGILILAPFIKKTGELLGKFYQSILYQGLNLSTFIMAFGIPPLTAFITNAILTGFVISVFSTCLNYGGLKILKNKSSDYFSITRGIGEKVVFIGNFSKINGYEFRQSLFMNILKIHNLNINLWGFGSERKSKHIFVPAIGNGEYVSFINSKIQPSQNSIFFKPNKKSLKSYLYLPFSFIVLTVVLGVYANHLNLAYDPFIPIFILCISLEIVWLIMRTKAFCKAYIFANTENAIVSFYTKMNYSTAVIPINKIQAMKTTHSIFQDKAGKCNFYIYIFAKKKRCFKIKHLNKSECMLLSAFIKNNCQ